MPANDESVTVSNILQLYIQMKINDPSQFSTKCILPNVYILPKSLECLFQKDKKLFITSIIYDVKLRNAAWHVNEFKFFSERSVLQYHIHFTNHSKITSCNQLNLFISLFICHAAFLSSTLYNINVCPLSKQPFFFWKRHS